MSRARFALLTALAVAASPLAAHETTRSYLALDREGAEVAADLRLAFRDIEVVSWMDEDLDGRITWGEAKARLDAATAYAAARVTLDAGGPCPLRPTGAGVTRVGGVDYLDLAFAATCPGADAPLRVGSTLFAEIDPSHRLFLTALDRGHAAGAVLGAEDGPTLLEPEAGPGGTFAAYFRAGVEHLLAGADHLLFLLVLILPAAVGEGGLRRRITGVVAAVTGFTLAHALTLTAAATDLLRPPASLIQVLIAVSILVTAMDNVRPFIPGPRAALAAFFGTIHGFGFATALAALPLGSAGFALALLGFNLGIEAAQVATVVLAMPALALVAGTPGGRGGRVVLWIGSAVAAGFALVWIWQRLTLLA